MITSAFDFVTTGAEFFDDEKHRAKNLRKTLKDLLGDNAEWEKMMADGNAKPDGVWVEGPHDFAYLVFEIKNEPGLGGDPFLKSLAVYGKIVEQKQVQFSSPARRIYV